MTVPERRDGESGTGFQPVVGERSEAEALRPIGAETLKNASSRAPAAAHFARPTTG